MGTERHKLRSMECLRVIGLKRCSKCGAVKSADQFYAVRTGWMGRQPNCRECSSRYSRIRNNGTAETKRFIAARLAELSIRRCASCHALVHFSDLTKNASDKHGVSVYCRACEQVIRKRAYHERGGREYQAQWAKDNPERRRTIERRWRERNPERARQVMRNHHAKKYATVEGNLNNRISCRLRYMLGSKKLRRRSLDVVGYTIDDLKTHLERQFLPGMTWANMGDWHIDHIVPLASFSFRDADDPEVRRAWALTNLRPIWAHDNHVKKDKREFLI